MIAAQLASDSFKNVVQLCCSMLNRPWGPMSGNMSSDRSQDIHKSYRIRGLLFGKQRSTITGKIFLSEDKLNVCDHGWGTVG